MRFSNLIWHAKQLLPLHYQTHFRDANGLHFCQWRMWFGRCFWVKDRLLDQNPL